MAGRTVITPQLSNEIVSDEVREQYSPPEPIIVSSRLNIPEPVLGPSKQHLAQKKFENEIKRNEIYSVIYGPGGTPGTTSGPTAEFKSYTFEQQNYFFNEL